MAKAENSSSEEPPPEKEPPPSSRRRISQAPPPLTPLPRGHAPPANTEPARPSAATVRALSHSFEVAASRCYEIIKQGESVKAVDQPGWWAYRKRCWSEVERPELDEAFAKCERAGVDTGELRMRIEKLDIKYKRVCELRNNRNDISLKSATPTVDPTKTGAPGRPTSMHFVIDEAKRRIASGEALRELAKESRYLAAWWNDGERSKYDGPPPSLASGTIENHVRVLRRRDQGSVRPTKL
jgi:hypothetical protein